MLSTVAYRRKAAGMFSDSEYLIEGIFGAEETRRHQLHCRFVRKDNRRLFAKGRAIAWNIRVLNRFECANRLNIPIPSYGGVAHAEFIRPVSAYKSPTRTKAPPVIDTHQRSRMRIWVLRKTRVVLE